MTEAQRKTYTVRVSDELGQMLDKGAKARDVPYQVFARSVIKYGLLKLDVLYPVCKGGSSNADDS